MKYIEKHPIIMILVGVLGISLSSILVRYSTAPSAVTATWRLLWTVILMTPVVLAKKRRPDGACFYKAEDPASEHLKRCVPGSALCAVV